MASTAPTTPAERSREDGRAANALRPPALESGVLHNADGSARFSSGRTQVLAAVYGPGNSRYGTWL